MSPSHVLLGLALLLQSLELRALPANQLWPLEALRQELPNFLREILSPRLYKFVQLVLGLNAVAVIFAPSPWQGVAVCIGLLGVLYSAARWRGSFNGGADQMTAIICLGLILSHLWSLAVGHVFIALHLSLSYLIAGSVKLKNRDWRSGRALQDILGSIENKPRDLKICAAMSWLVIAFELSFPLAWLDPRLCMAYAAVGISFHFANFWLFGLNRFFWAWLAAYPSLVAVAATSLLH